MYIAKCVLFSSISNQIACCANNLAKFLCLLISISFLIICLRQLGMSSGKKLILEHFRKQQDALSLLEEKISRLETATKQKLQEFSQSSKKAKLYVDEPFNLEGVKKNLFQSTLKYMELEEQPQQQSQLLLTPENKIQSSRKHRKEQHMLLQKQTKSLNQLSELRLENKRLKTKLQQSDQQKLQSQIELYELAERLQNSIKKHLARKLKK